MGAITYDHTSPIPPAKLFNIILDADKLIPRILPQAVKSVDILQGDGHQTGTIYAAQFGEGSPHNSVKIHVDEVDEENFIYKYTVIEGDALQDVIEKIAFEVQILPTTDGGSADGGSIISINSTYYTKSDAEITEDVQEIIKSGKEIAAGILFEALDAYLSAYPNAY
ncbi:major allergen Pru ar 1-like [Coffea eugenioides]|uniref:major allergen Pru ar 1-like n=1 Tax=Coffea eugenioides TaxID=49369 RepID=UPI000F60AB40|nr:major allergen Pru ar 1-like [Coffea eugenioides]